MGVQSVECRLLAPRPLRRVSRKASRVLRGDRTKRDQRRESREEEARASPSG